MGTSVASRGKILLAEKFSQPIPDGWATDKDGRPTTDARAALDGLLLPFGGYKGYALSVMITLLGGALTGAGIGSDIKGPFDLSCNNGYLLAAIDIKRFMPMEEFRQRVDRYLQELKQARRASGVDRIYVPGEIEHETMQRRQREGVPLGSEVQGDALRLARELGVRPLAHEDS
jgi:LDH2 family malate/lactate/ureidoglycolate dehydrogenase